MKRCPHCGSEFDGYPGQKQRGSLPDVLICPHCGQECPRDEDDAGLAESSLVPIARFTNLAELGYFEEMLADHRIEMAVREVDEFNAIQGQWIRRYILSVAPEDAGPATELMQEQLGADDRRTEAMDATAVESGTSYDHWDRGFDRDRHRDDDFALDPAKLWVPVALVVLGGGLAIWALTADPTEDVPAGKMLWDALSESSAPLQSQPGPEGESRRLQFDPQTGNFILDEDTDGDRRFDRQRVYSQEELVIERGD